MNLYGMETHSMETLPLMVTTNGSSFAAMACENRERSPCSGGNESWESWHGNARDSSLRRSRMSEGNLFKESNVSRSCVVWLVI
jgi:hypothetical protein